MLIINDLHLNIADFHNFLNKFRGWYLIISELHLNIVDIVCLITILTRPFLGRLKGCKTHSESHGDVRRDSGFTTIDLGFKQP